MGWDARKTVQMAAVAVVVVGGVAGAVVLSQPSDAADPAGPAATTSVAAPLAPGANVTNRELTMGIAQSVWQESWAARESKDASAYEASTCSPYIQEETKRRRARDTADLLDAFEESKKYRPPWSITDHTLIAVDHPGGNSARLRTEATVTDNRNVPPTTDRRTVEYDLKYNDGRWKLCPSTTPLG